MRRHPLPAVGAGDTLAREPTAAREEWGLAWRQIRRSFRRSAATDLFARSGEEGVWSSIASQARLVHHPPGKDITEQGGGAAGFHLIKRGTASVHVGGKDRPDLGPGDYFGEISMMPSP